MVYEFMPHFNAGETRIFGKACCFPWPFDTPTIEFLVDLYSKAHRQVQAPPLVLDPAAELASIAGIYPGP